MRARTVGAQAGTFAIARGRDEGYRVLTAPEFLVAARRAGLLSDLASADGLNGGVAHGRSELAGGQPVFVTYTSRLVTADDLDEVGRQRLGSPPSDAFGRPLRIVYGVAYQARAAAGVPPSLLDAAERAAITAFRVFVADETGYRLRASPPVLGPMVADRNSPVVDGELGTYGERASGPMPVTVPRGAPRRPLLLLAGMAVAVTVALVLAVTSLGSSGGPGAQPRASASPSASPPLSPNPGAPLLVERTLRARLSGHVGTCGRARGSDRIAGAEVVLDCSIADQRTQSPITVAGFATLRALGRFMDAEKRTEEADARRDKEFASWKAWTGEHGRATGHVLTYRDTHNRAWIVWSFERDGFVTAHRMYVVVKASGADAAALRRWWATHPI